MPSSLNRLEPHLSPSRGGQTTWAASLVRLLGLSRFPRPDEADSREFDAAD